MMGRILKKQDVLEMIYGACLMGGGGGGSLENGLSLLEAFDKETGISMEMISVDEIPAGKYVGTCGGFGSPQKYKELGANCTACPTSAYHALQRMGYTLNRHVSYLMALEYGALNMMLPFMVANGEHIPLVDADGTGRAVPSIQTLLYGANDVPITPYVFTDPDENITIMYPSDYLNFAHLDKASRFLCQASDMVAGCAFGIVTADDIRDNLAPGAYTYAQNVGKALIRARDGGTDVMDELKKATPCKEFFRGTVTKFGLESKGGWDWGSVYFDGAEEYRGKQYHLDYQNETLVLWEGDSHVLMTAPDMICAVDLDTGLPVSNADFQEGMNCLILGIPAHKNWFKSPKGIQNWQNHFDVIGYKGEVVRF